MKKAKSHTDLYNGIYRDLANEDYRNAPGLSRSELVSFMRSVEHYEHHEKTESAALNNGIALHYAILEPEKFNEFCIAGPTQTIGVKWRQMQEESPEKIIVDPVTYECVNDIKKSFWNDPVASKLLQNGEQEVSFFWQESFTGQLLKARPDYWREDKKLLIDLKFVRSGGSLEDEFNKSIQYYKYYIQAAMYLEGLRICTRDEYKTFVFIVIEKEAPFNVQCYFLSDDWLEIGINQFNRAIINFAEYQLNPEAYKLNKKKMQELHPPKWMMYQFMEGEL